jgi:hypothetical protein
VSKNNLSATSTTLLSNVNTLSVALKTTYSTLINVSTNSQLSINNLNASSTTIFNNLNSLSELSLFFTNYTNLSSFIVSGTTKLNNSVTRVSSLNVSGY